MKATYGEITNQKMSGKSVEPREIFKDPVTDDGTKKSKKGLLAVHNKCTCSETEAIDCGSKCNTSLYVKDQQSWEEESQGLLQTVFKDGKLVKTITLDEIRNKLKI